MKIVACYEAYGKDSLLLVVDFGLYWQNVKVYRNRPPRYDAIIPKSFYEVCGGDAMHPEGRHIWFAEVFRGHEPSFVFFRHPFKVTELTFEAVKAEMLARGLWREPYENSRDKSNRPKNPLP